MEKSNDSQFNGSSSYSVDGGTFTIKSSSLPQGGTYHWYDVTLGKNGGSINIDVNALTAGNKVWVFTVSLPKGSTGVDFSFNFVNHSSGYISASESYHANTNTTHLYFSTRESSNTPSYIEIVLPGRPWGDTGGGALVRPGGSYYSSQPGYCFLAGAMVEAEHGEVAVETLTVGQRVMTYDACGNNLGLQPITWIGHKTRIIQDTGYDDVDQRPICIMKGALGRNSPVTDLHVTPEHCLLIDGLLVPARLLVNQRSIVFRNDIGAYSYYHFKTAHHAIIRANGVLTETLRDDIQFFSAACWPIPNSEQAAWAAPLCSDDVVARAIYMRVEQRAIEAGLACCAPMKILTSDPDLHLILANGDRIDPLRMNGRWAVFSIPAEQTGVKLVSRYARPCDVNGPFVDDRRELGVCVGDITLFGADTTRPVTVPTQKGGASGWWRMAEGDEGRWTTGCADLAFDIPTETQALLTIELLQAGPYLEYAPARVALRDAA